MKFKFSLALLFFLVFLFGFVTPKLAFADSFTLSGTVKDSSGDPISDATVSVNTANLDQTTTDSNGNYTLLITGGVYDIQVTPPANSTFSSAIYKNQNISSNTVINFILTSAGTVVLSGYLYDAQGNPLSNQTIRLTQPSSGQQFNSTTDASGSYSISTSANTYLFEILGTNNDFSLNIPQYYDLISSGFSLTQSTYMDITLPVKRVDVHVQDSSGNAQSDVTLQTSFGQRNPSLSIGNDLTVSVQNSLYGFAGVTGPGPKTDASGDVTLWLFANDPDYSYTFTAVPPSTSNFLTLTLNKVNITEDTNKIITLQEPVTLSGHLYDSQGNSLPNQKVTLIQPNSGAQVVATSDSLGNYSLTTTPGTYTLELSGKNDDFSLNIPQYYSLLASGYSLTQDTTLDFTLPTKKVTTHVQDTSDNPISGVELQVPLGQHNPSLSLSNGLTVSVQHSAYGIQGTTGEGPLTDALGSVTLWLFPNDPDYSYPLTAVPPSNSSYTTSTLNKVNITEDTNKTITLQQPVTLSGHLYDALDNPISDQKVSLTEASSGQKVDSTTSSSGSYSITVSPGTYLLQITGINNDFSLNVPQYYYLSTSGYSLTQDTTADFTLPVKEVIVHVQNDAGIPVSDVTLKTSLGTRNPSIDIGSGVSVSVLHSAYGVQGTTSAGPLTDTSGNVALWLFANDPDYPYTLTAVPPSGSDYSIFTLNNVDVTINQTEVISLQSSQPTPTPTVEPTNTPTPTPTSTPTPTVTPTPTPRNLTAVNPATVYVSRGGGLFNTFNIKAEIFKDSTLVTSGTKTGVNPFLGTTTVTIPFTSFSPVNFPTGSLLKINVSACSTGGLFQGPARLHYNAASVDSRFSAVIGGTNTTYHLRSGSVLGTSAGTSAQTVNSNSNSNCSTYTSFGIWTATP